MISHCNIQKKKKTVMIVLIIARVAIAKSRLKISVLVNHQVAVMETM